MANMQFANNAATTLASGITNTATSLTVASASAFPAITGSQYFYCTLIDAATNSVIEIIKVTAVSGTTFTVVRAQDGTTASAYLAGDKVELRLVRANLNDFPKLDESNTFTGQVTATQLAASNGVILNATTATNNFTVPTGQNASSIGPFIIPSGVAFTISSGQRWVIF